MSEKTRQISTKSYEKAEISFKTQMIPHADAFAKGKFDELYLRNTSVNEAVKGLIEAAYNEGKLGDAKELFMKLTHKSEDTFIYLVEMQRRLNEGSIRHIPKFGEVKPLATG